jgi:hypothetical protein
MEEITDLIKFLGDSKALAQEKLQNLGGDNEYFLGYIAAINHAIQLATFQQILLTWNLSIGTVTQNTLCK